MNNVIHTDAFDRKRELLEAERRLDTIREEFIYNFIDHYDPEAAMDRVHAQWKLSPEIIAAAKALDTEGFCEKQSLTSKIGEWAKYIGVLAFTVLVATGALLSIYNLFVTL